MTRKYALEGRVTGKGLKPFTRRLALERHGNDLFLYFEPRGFLAFVSPAAVEAAEGPDIHFKRKDVRWGVNISRADMLRAIAALTPAPGLGGFGMARLTRAAAEAQLALMPERNQFSTNQYDNFGARDTIDGRFTWDDKQVRFEFYGAGKLHTITVSMEELLLGGDSLLLAPKFTSGQLTSQADRWVGARTEWVGDAHSYARSTLWEKAAWNTVNRWCTAWGRGAKTPALINIMEAAQHAYARIVEEQQVFYFLDEDKGGAEVPAMRALRSHGLNYKGVTTPANIEKALPPQHFEYFMVARDAFLEGGAKSQLRGLSKRGSISQKQVQFAMKKLGRKVEACGITKKALREGMAVEREHRDVTKGGIEKTARIAAAHLCERKDYYKRLEKYVEPKGKKR